MAVHEGCKSKHGKLTRSERDDSDGLGGVFVHCPFIWYRLLDVLAACSPSQSARSRVNGYSTCPLFTLDSHWI